VKCHDTINTFGFICRIFTCYEKGRRAGVYFRFTLNTQL